VEELQANCTEHEGRDLVIFTITLAETTSVDAHSSAALNSKVPVKDRTGLILDIFASAPTYP